MRDRVFEAGGVAWLVILTLLLWLVGMARAQPMYELTDLGSEVRVNGLSDRGEISGTLGGQVVILRNGEWQPQPPCVGNISRDGWLVGQVAYQDSTPCVAKGTLRVLTLPNDLPSGVAMVRLRDGIVFGHGSNPSTSETVPLRWRNASSVFKMPTLGGDAVVVDADPSKIAVGLAQVPEPIYYAPVWWDADLTIHRFPIWPEAIYTGVWAINNDHMTCGIMVRPSGLPRPNEIEVIPVLWDIYGRIYELPRLPGYMHGWATAIADPQNAKARVVGHAMVRDDSLIPPPVAVMWGPETDRQEAIPLASLVTNAPGWTLERAIAINNVGQILGVNRTGGYRAWLLTPVEQVAGR